jgi:hypothetical protein
MIKFKLNKKYNHKSDKIYDALHIDEKRESEIVDKVVEYWYSLSPEKFMISKILDFIEQQDWTMIEKLYATERFTSLYEDEATFGDYNDELIDYIIKEWKKKGSVVDENETKEYLKHMFKLLMGYNLNCLIDTLKDIDSLAEKHSKENPDTEDDEDEITPEEHEEQRKNILLNHAIRNIDSAIPKSFGIAIFNKEGYIVIGKNPDAAKLIQNTLENGQKGFIVDIEANLGMYQ